MKFLSFLFFVFLVSPVVTFAQANFFKGYVVTLSNDTLSGFVQGRERIFNPRFVRFKQTMADEPRRLPINECAAFGIDLGDRYERHFVSISLSKDTISTAGYGIDTTMKTDTVFLKVLHRGKNVSLYTYVDEIKERFYLKEESSAPFELVRNVYYDSKGLENVVIQSKYRNQLLLLMRKYGVDESQEWKIEKTGYNQSDLLKLVNLINHEKANKNHFPGSRFFVNAGINTGSVQYEDGTPLALGKNQGKNEFTVSPLLTAGVDFFVNPATQKMIFRLELSVLRSKMEVSAYPGEQMLSYINHSFKQTTLALTPQIVQNIYNAPNTKVFMGIGFGLNFPFFSDNIIERNFIGGTAVTYTKFEHFDVFYASVPVMAGVEINKKIGLNVGYTFPSKINKNPTTIIKVDRYQMGLSYFFGKR